MADTDQTHSLAVMSDENVANPHKTSQDEEESPHQSKISCNFFIIRKMVWPKVSFSSSLSLSSGGGLIQASRSRGKMTIHQSGLKFFITVNIHQVTNNSDNGV